MEKKKKPADKKLNKSALKEMANKMLWRENISYYNTVGSTANCVSFFWMQFIRLISFLALFINSGFFAFIFLKKSLAYINFWSLVLSTISFGCLFIGSGMQVCEQQLIR